MENKPASIFDQLVTESDRLMKLDSISGEQFRPLKELINRAVDSHQFVKDQLVKILENKNLSQ